MFPDDKIAEIRERADIVEVISEYVSLKKAGINYKGVCPFHADSDPSFNVNPARYFYHCFGCGVSGDVFSFLQNIEGIDFMEAAKRLALKYGIQLPEKQMDSKQKALQDREKTEKQRRLYILEMATIFFEEQLQSQDAQVARDALQKRKISEKSVKDFRMGFAPDSWDKLLNHLKKNRVSENEALSLGLIKPRKSGDGFYDAFRNRLMFTITDSQGHPIAFSGRALCDDDNAKYINSPETREYTKGKVLFGLYQARVEMSKQKEAVLVEGNFDVVAMHDAGFKNVVAPLGTAFTVEQASLLKRRVDKVTVMFDGDRAGIKAAFRAFPIIAGNGLAGYMVKLPEKEDPDSFLRNFGSETLEKSLSEAKGLLDEIIIMTASATDGSSQDISRRVKKLHPLINSLKDSMERDLYIQKTASAFRIDPSLVFKYLKEQPQKEVFKELNSGIAPLPGYADERELLGLL
ncbi:MAG: DNA primase, partial [Deltaproteobacteria bacterium]|nr:DNA primase [Deltaproteobacteria bacterium]